MEINLTSQSTAEWSSVAFISSQAGAAGSAAIRGVLERASRRHTSFDEWDDWLDGDEHSDSDADDDDGD